MSVINSALLAKMRADVEARLPDTAVIYTVSRTSDGAGGWSDSLVASGTAICRVDPIGSSAVEARVVSNRDALTITYRLTLPYDTAIAVDNQVVIDGRTYQVVQMTVDHSWNVSKRVIISEVR